jgi:hypothetical protein
VNPRQFLTRNQRLKCTCSGYWFPHRKGGGACDHSKTRDIHLAIRYGNTEAYWEAFVSFAWEYPGKPGGAEPPF